MMNRIWLYEFERRTSTNKLYLCRNVRSEIMTKTIENFLRYVKIDTQSSEESTTTPSTMKQHDLAGLLVSELETMGATEITYDWEHCYVYATVPASAGCENAPVLGFIAHMDTSPAVTDTNVKPRIVEDYDGKDIVLNAAENIVMKTADFPELLNYVGKDLIVTDGTTLLGADDKAGVAEIMTMAEDLLDHPEKKHGKIRIGFTPDEEVGAGADHFDVELFGADYAYTVDGGALGELEYENFNAAGAKIVIKGVSVHTGYAKGKMVNASRLAVEFQNMIPENETPEQTEGYQGFYHLIGIESRCEEAKLSYIIRDHDRNKFESRKDFIEDCVNKMNEKYGDGTVKAVIYDQYYNMKEKIDPNMHVIDIVLRAMQESGVPPRVEPIRGGTDGAQLSFKGLPCPNIFAGGVNFHGPHEFVSIQVMEKVVKTIVKIAEITEEYND